MCTHCLQVGLPSFLYSMVNSSVFLQLFSLQLPVWCLIASFHSAGSTQLFFVPCVEWTLGCVFFLRQTFVKLLDCPQKKLFPRRPDACFHLPIALSRSPHMFYHNLFPSRQPVVCFKIYFMGTIFLQTVHISANSCKISILTFISLVYTQRFVRWSI